MILCADPPTLVCSTAWTGTQPISCFYRACCDNNMPGGSLRPTSCPPSLRPRPLTRPGFEPGEPEGSLLRDDREPR